MASSNRDYHRLLELADTQEVIEKIKAIIEEGGIAAASRKLGISNRNVCLGISRLEKRLILRGYHPDSGWTNPVPQGTLASGVSTLYDKGGAVAMQWVKSSLDKEKMLQHYRDAAYAMIEELPKFKPVKLDRKIPKNNLCTLYNLFDYHFGMKSWPAETGDDWNLKIAEDMMYKIFAYGFQKTPEADQAIINLGGDFFHFDGYDAVTPTSKHLLDADTRYRHVIKVAAHTVRKVVTMALKKHKKVHIIVQEGNHDPVSSAWLSTLLYHVYSEERRITVDPTPVPYYCFEWGLTSLFFHHGHLKKMVSLDSLFASRYREIFGRTKYSYAHMGHNHHKLVRESSLMITQQHSTMTAKDSYAARYGFDSMRGTEFHTYSKQFGLMNILPVSPEMLN